MGYPASESRSPDVLLRLKNVLVGFACKNTTCVTQLAQVGATHSNSFSGTKWVR